ncbi:MAG TPA: nucleoside recognition domain-containing protein, partial [Myxococcota bacterium]|nr:nucleoside recognition domain-containing protein [Myxococcota bacterium]
MLVGAVVCGALTGKLDAVAKASTDSANAAVTLSLGLVGVMSFWLGLMRVLHDGGLMRGIARVLRPVMVRLFPDVPSDHPAMSMMILNMTSNILGLGNAATPFGLKAMQELDRLNPHKGAASNAMALFLAINTSGLAVLPTGMIALRASMGSQAPGSIFLTTVLSTLTATFAGVVTAKVLGPLPFFRVREPAAPAASDPTEVTAQKEIDISGAQAQVEVTLPTPS